MQFGRSYGHNAPSPQTIARHHRRARPGGRWTCALLPPGVSTTPRRLIFPVSVAALIVRWGQFGHETAPSLAESKMLVEDYVTFACCRSNLESVSGKTDDQGIDLRHGVFFFADNINALAYFTTQSGWGSIHTIMTPHRLPLMGMPRNTPKRLLARPADHCLPVYCKSFRHAG